MIHYRNLKEDEINLELFCAFDRRQIVNDCLRKENGKWVVKSDPFIDDWSREDYEFLVRCLKNTVMTGGLVCGAFSGDKCKGFVSVEGNPIGSCRQYMDLSSIHVSRDMRGQGIGRELFAIAKKFVQERNVSKLYISAHSAVESQAFYRAMGCVEAEEYDAGHVAKEPYDCQLECDVRRNHDYKDDSNRIF